MGRIFVLKFDINRIENNQFHSYFFRLLIIGPNDEYDDAYNNIIHQSNNITISCEKISDTVQTAEEIPNSKNDNSNDVLEQENYDMEKHINDNAHIHAYTYNKSSNSNIQAHVEKDAFQDDVIDGKNNQSNFQNMGTSEEIAQVQSKSGMN